MGIALVTHAIGTGSSGGATTPAVDTTGVNLILLTCATPAITTPSDSKGNTWTSLTPTLHPGDGFKSVVYYCLNPTVGTGHTFTITCAAGFSPVAMQAFSGVASLTTQAAGNTSTSASTIQPGSITPSINGSLLVTSLSAFPSGTFTTATIDSGYTVSDIQPFISGTSYGVAMAYLIQATAGAVNPTWTPSSAAEVVATMASFAPTALVLTGPTTTYPKVWLKADAGVYKDAGVTLCANGDTVRQFNDQSGNGNHCTQATSGNRPAYVTGAYNSLPAVRFTSGSSNYLSNPYTALPKTCVVVGKCTASTTSAWLGNKGSGGSYDALYFQADDSSNKWNNTQITTSAGVSVVDLQTYSPKRGSQLYIHAFRLTTGASNVLEQFIDGVRTGQSSTSSTLATPTAAAIGADYFAQALTAYLAGDICELLIYDVPLSDTELPLLFAYLQTKWASSALGALGDRLNRQYLGTTFQSHPGDTSPDVNETFHLLGSDNAATFFWYKPDYRPTHTYARDISIARSGFGSTLWIVHTAEGAAGGYFANCPYISLAKSTDGGRTFLPVRDIAGPSGTCICWAPEWARNTDGTLYLDGSGLPHVLISVNLSLDDNTFQMYETHPTNATDWSQSWSTPVLITGTSLPSDMIDPFPRFLGGTTFEIYYKHEPNSSGGIAVLKSTTSLTSGYVQDRTISGWGAFEGPAVLPIGSTLRLFADSTNFLGVAYGDSSDGGSTYGSPNAVTSEGIIERHGTIIKRPAVAYLCLAVAVGP